VETVLRVSVDESPENGRHQLTDEDRRRSVSPEARARRRKTIAQRRAERAEAVIFLRQERRMVPEAIADYLGISDGQVRTYLREAKALRQL
jgi:DNA-directed RNA polymerase specialized sigma24 family protein